MPQPVNSQNKPMTQYIDAGIPQDGDVVWLAGFGDRGSAWRNRANARPVTQTSSYDDDITEMEPPIYRNKTGADWVAGKFKKGHESA